MSLVWLHNLRSHSPLSRCLGERCDEDKKSEFGHRHWYWSAPASISFVFVAIDDVSQIFGTDLFLRWVCPLTTFGEVAG